MPRKKKQAGDTAQPQDTVVIDIPKLSKPLQLVKGMKDVLPADQPYAAHIYRLIDTIMSDYSIDRIDVPVVEDLQLYTHGIGRQTDIVEKEMYTFDDQGGDHLALRPEFTAGIARAYIEHGMMTYPQPVKVYTTGPLFRHEKPQEGRYRQHNQFDIEYIGEAKPAADAQIIFIAYKVLKSLGIAPILHINSIGCPQCRGPYKEALSEYYKSKRQSLCEDCKRRMSKNVLRLLDCKDEQCQVVKSKSPSIDEFLCDLCRDHFMSVLTFIDEFEIPYQFNPYLVRGIDYYTRTVFEYMVPQEGKEDAATKMQSFCGGGRYDYLIESLGGQPTPACGFGMGIERVILKLKEMERNNIATPIKKKRDIDVFFAQLGEQAKQRAMMLFEDLLEDNFSVAEAFTKDSLKSQLEMANKLGARFTLILGQKELLDGTIIIRNMEGGEQEVIDVKKLIPILRKKLGIEVKE